MTEDFNIETYLYISSDRFIIFLFDKKKILNIFKEELNLDKNKQGLDFQILSKFLDDNIFKIEKLFGKFITNIYLVIENSKIDNVKLSIKKKNYDKIITKKYLENILTEAKDLFKENYQEARILHILVNNYSDNNNSYSFFSENLYGDYLSLEIQFTFISKNFASLVEKTLEKFQIRVIKYLDGYYIKNYFKNEKIELPEMICKINDGCNQNEIHLIQKNKTKSGFFEQFFQLFS